MCASTKKKKARVRRVLVVDDHQVVREGFTALINQQTDMKVCGEAQSHQEALKQYFSNKPNMAIIDLTLKNSSGLDLIKSLHAKDKDFPMLVVSVHDEALYAERALAAGALGYIMKAEASSTILTALRTVLSGEIYVSPPINARLKDRLVGTVSKLSVDPIARLTNREIEVFRLIGIGYTTKQIAEELHISSKTIDTHRHHIKTKLGIRSMGQLISASIHSFFGDK